MKSTHTRILPREGGKKGWCYERSMAGAWTRQNGEEGRKPAHSRHFPCRLSSPGVLCVRRGRALGALDREEPLEKGAIAAQRDPQILGRCRVRLAQLLFEGGTFPGERLRQPLHDLGDELVRAPHGCARIVDEADLDRIPFRPELIGDLPGEQRGGMPLVARRLDVLGLTWRSRPFRPFLVGYLLCGTVSGRSQVGRGQVFLVAFSVTDHVRTSMGVIAARFSVFTSS